MSVTPTNGMYLTMQDFKSWSDEFDSKFYRFKEGMQPSTEEDNSVGFTNNVTFVVTEACNLNCTYCYEHHKTTKRMTKEVAFKAVDMLFDKEKINGYFNHDRTSAIILDFIGGEPLLEIDLIDSIVEYFKFKAFELNSPWATNYMISISSNGVLFLTDKVQKFIQRNENRVSIGITIDGNKELHDKCRLFHDGRGSYDIVEKAVKELVKMNPNQQTKITLCHENIQYLFEAITNVWELGIVCAYTNCVYEDVWNIEDAKILYREMKKLADYIVEHELYKSKYCSLFSEDIGDAVKDLDSNWCGGNGQMLAIGTDGKCYPCLRFMKYALKEGRKEQPVGCISKGLDSKNENKFLLELKGVTLRTQSDDKCLNCPIGGGCSLCTGFNYDEFGTPNKRATYSCITHQARVMANTYYWNKLYKKLNIDKTMELNIPRDWALEIIDEKEFDMLRGGNK